VTKLAPWSEVVTSTKVDATAVAAELVAQLRAACAEVPCAAIVYADVLHDHAQLLGELQRHLPDTKFVGASSSGFSVQGIYREDTRFAAVAFLGGEGVSANVAFVNHASSFEGDLGATLASQLGPAAGPHTLLVWYNPLRGLDAQTMLDGLAAQGYRAVYGGGAGQPWGPMLGTYQFAADCVYSDCVVAMRIGGLEPVAELTHGMQGVGVELVVTRAVDNVVFELDNKPALDVWNAEFGVTADNDASSVATWALGVKHPDNDPYEGLITRSPFLFSNEQRSLTFQAAIPTGTTVQLCARTTSAVYDGAVAMAGRLSEALEGRTRVLTLSFECAARSAPFLGTEMTENELLAMQRKLGNAAPWLGMYAWGELAPTTTRSYFHNFALPLCVLCTPVEAAVAATARQIASA
jgi:hypothetical protein